MILQPSPVPFSESVGVAKFEFFFEFFEKWIKFLKFFTLNLRMTACCLTSLSGSFSYLLVGFPRWAGARAPPSSRGVASLSPRH